MQFQWHNRQSWWVNNKILMKIFPLFAKVMMLFLQCAGSDSGKVLCCQQTVFFSLTLLALVSVSFILKGIYVWEDNKHFSFTHKKKTERVRKERKGRKEGRRGRKRWREGRRKERRKGNKREERRGRERKRKRPLLYIMQLK